MRGGFKALLAGLVLLSVSFAPAQAQVCPFSFFDDWEDGQFGPGRGTAANGCQYPAWTEVVGAWQVTEDGAGGPKVFTPQISGGSGAAASYTGPGAFDWEVDYRSTSAGIVGIDKTFDFFVYMLSADFQNGYVARVQLSTSRGPVLVLGIGKQVGGNLESLGGRPVHFGLPDTSPHTLRLTRSDIGVLTLFFDGIQVIQLTDTDFSSFQLVGMGVEQPEIGIVLIDEIRITGITPPPTAPQLIDQAQADLLTAEETLTQQAPNAPPGVSSKIASGSAYEKLTKAEEFLARGKDAEAAQKILDAATQTQGTIDQINSLRCSAKGGKRCIADSTANAAISKLESAIQAMDAARGLILA